METYGLDAKSECRSDPLPFILLSADESLCRNTTFVDIDYEKLMVNRKLSIEKSDDITQLLQDVEFLPNDSPILVRSKNYVAVGCDLKNLEKLDEVLRRQILPSECSVLFLAEVSLTYMDVNSATAVLQWAAKLSNGQKYRQFPSLSRIRMLTRYERCSILHIRAVFPRRTGASFRIGHDEAL